jgi:hypothetical protein
MALDTAKRKQVIYFTGVEIENTVMKGFQTLFVVGIRPVEEIARLAIDNKAKHIYFGTSQSFIIDEQEKLKDWIDILKTLLEKDFWITLDFGIEYIEQVTASGLMSYKKFIPMISAKLPNIYKINANATLKIDDVTWGHSNTGVWSKNLKEITNSMHYTDWKEYVGDTVIDVDTDE